MNYDLVVDTTKLDTLLTDITDGTTAVSTALTNIFSEYEALGTRWTGDNFDTFITKIRGFKPEVEKCLNAFTAFGELVQKAIDDAGTLETNVASGVSGITAGFTGSIGNGGRQVQSMADDSTTSFDYAQIKAALDSLQAQYEAFYTAINNMDVSVAQNVQVADQSAILGARGNQLINFWVTNCSKYKSYYNMFRKWSSVIIEASGYYKEFEAGYQAEGTEATSLGDIQENLDVSSMPTFDQLRAEAALLSGSTMVGGTALPLSVDGSGRQYYEIGDTRYYVETGADGSVTRVTTADGTEVYHSLPSMEQAIADMRESNPDGWIQQAYREYGPEGAAVAANMQAEAAMAQSVESTLNEWNSPTAGDQFEIEIISPTDDRWKDASHIMLQDACDQRDAVKTESERASDYRDYYYSVVVHSEPYTRMSAAEQAAWDARVDAYATSYSEAYSWLEHETYWGIWDDGRIGNADSWITWGDESAYHEACSAIQEANNMTSSLESPDAFFTDMYTAFGAPDLGN